MSKITNWPPAASTPFLSRLDRFRNKFGMTGSIIGFFPLPGCLRIAVITPDPQGCAVNATTNLHCVKKEITMWPKCRFSGSEFLHPFREAQRGNKSGEEENRHTYPNKIFRLTFTSPSPPNKINFRNVSSRRKFGIISSATQQIRKSANPQIRKSANQQISPSISSPTACTSKQNKFSKR